MTDPQQQELRDELEAQHRKQIRRIIFSLATALATALGGGTYGYLDSVGQDDLRTVVATHVAVGEAEHAAVVRDLESLQDQNRRLLQTVSELKGVVEALTRRSLRYGLPRGYDSIRAGRPLAPPTADMVQRKKMELFEEEE